MKKIRIIFLFFLMPFFAFATLKTHTPQYQTVLEAQKTSSRDDERTMKKQIKAAKIFTFLGAAMVALPFLLPVSALSYGVAVSLIYLGSILLGAGLSIWIGIKYLMKREKRAKT